MAEKRIKIVCKTGFDLKLAEINNLQGDLKELTPENEAKLRKEIEETGFAFAPHVWRDPSNRKFYLIDGHQRVLVVRKMIADGWKCDGLPVVTVSATSAEEAKRRVLQSISQYGTVTNQGLYNFATGMKIDIDSLTTSFKIPDIDLIKWKSSYFAPIAPPTSNEEQKSTEVEQGQFSKLVHTCPKCGFSFGAE